MIMLNVDKKYKLEHENKNVKSFEKEMNNNKKKVLQFERRDTYVKMMLFYNKKSAKNV